VITFDTLHFISEGSFFINIKSDQFYKPKKVYKLIRLCQNLWSRKDATKFVEFELKCGKCNNEHNLKYTHQLAVKSTTTSFGPALASSSLKWRSSSIIRTAPIVLIRYLFTLKVATPISIYTKVTEILQWRNA